MRDENQMRVFVAAWQDGQTVGEVSRETGMSVRNVNAWAATLRKKGVPLKRRKCDPLGGKHVDVRSNKDWGVSAERFVRAYQSSGTITEVMKKTGLSRHLASARAKAYIKKGVPLKKMPSRREETDWKGLAKLAASYTKDGWR